MLLGTALAALGRRVGGADFEFSRTAALLRRNSRVRSVHRFSTPLHLRGCIRAPGRTV
jgi:hypothetical protein